MYGLAKKSDSDSNDDAPAPVFVVVVDAILDKTIVVAFRIKVDLNKNVILIVVGGASTIIDAWDPGIFRSHQLLSGATAFLKEDMLMRLAN